MSVWREVQEQLYRRWRDQWVVAPGGEPLTPYVFANEKFDAAKVTAPAGWDASVDPWARFSCRRMPGGPGTMGRPGNRKMDRVGLVFVQLFEPPLRGVGRISDLGEKAARIFESCRLTEPHDIRFGEVEPGEAGDVERGRWWGLSVEGRFDYEQLI